MRAQPRRFLDRLTAFRTSFAGVANRHQQPTERPQKESRNGPGNGMPAPVADYRADGCQKAEDAKKFHRRHLSVARAEPGAVVRRKAVRKPLPAARLAGPLQSAAGRPEISGQDCAPPSKDQYPG